MMNEKLHWQKWTVKNHTDPQNLSRIFAFSNQFGSRDLFHGRYFFHKLGNGLWMIQVYYSYHVLYLYYYYV